MVEPSPYPRPDAAALQRIRWRLAHAGHAPWLHAEIARRMAERLPLLKERPKRWIDWWATLGAMPAEARQAWPDAHCVVVENDAAFMRRWSRPAGWLRRLGLRRSLSIDAHLGAVPESTQADLLWANMVLPHAADAPTLLSQWHAALRVDGVLMLSTLGPDTWAGIRAIYDAERWGPPMLPFVDMHDLGDQLVAQGFVDPVIDQERLVLHWSSPEALLAELRSLGGNAHPFRHTGLRTRHWRERLLRALAARADASGRIAMPVEVVYAQAFKAAPRAAAGETRIDAETLRRQLRLSPRPGSDSRG